MNMRFIAFTACVVVSSSIEAANTPLSVTGFNADEVMENNGSTYAVGVQGEEGDTSQPTLFESGLDGYSDGLPVSGTIVSGSGTTFQLQPYGSNGVPSNNALRLFDGATGTLTLTTPEQLSSLSILAFSASGGATNLSLTITFVDNSTLVTTYSAPDWSTPSTAISGLGRSNTSGTTFTYDSTDGAIFGMTETIINLSNTTEPVESLTFTGATTNNLITATSVFAVSATAAQSLRRGCYTPWVLFYFGERFRRDGL